MINQFYFIFMPNILSIISNIKSLFLGDSKKEMNDKEEM